MKRIACSVGSIVLSTLITLLAPSAAAGLLWSQTLGGDGTNETIHDLLERPDGSLLVAAHSDSFGLRLGDAWLLALDAEGVVLEEQVYAHELPGGTQGAALAPDGSALFAGQHTIDFRFERHAWLLKVAADGSIDWSRVFVLNPGLHAFADVTTTSDGGYLAAGTTSQGDAPPIYAWVVDLDAAGSVQQQWVWGTGRAENANHVIETTDGGFAIAGWTVSDSGGTDVWVMKLDAGGGIEWQRRYGGFDSDEPTELIQLDDGGYALAAFSNSFSASGHSPWALRLDPDGNVVWQRLFGDQEWGDFRGVSQTADGQLLFTGRIFEPGMQSNDLWLVKLDAADGTTLWQRAYKGTQGDWGSFSRELADSDLLVAGVWAWGFAEEELWLQRLDPEGQLPGCLLIRDTTLSSSSPRIDVADTDAQPIMRQIPDLDIDFTANPAASTSEQLCAAAPCNPLSCETIDVSPQPVCEGEPQSFSVAASGGEGALSVEWDFDGDGSADASGNPVDWTLPPGDTLVTASVSDSCAGGAQSCSLDTTAAVLPGTPPAEVSQLAAADPPLKLVKGPSETLTVSLVPEADSYNAYTDQLGSWYNPTAATGSACHLDTWVDNGDGSISISVVVPDDSWLLVTASTACAEGPAGINSSGQERTDVGVWERCGPTP